MDAPLGDGYARAERAHAALPRLCGLAATAVRAQLPADAVGPLARADNVVSLVDSVGLATRLSGAMRAIMVPHARLALFVGFLRHCGVLPKEQEYTLAEQETLQKCAFIARDFGLDLGYEWHLHEYGTFSSFLAADHVELVEGDMRIDFGELVALESVPGYLELAGSQDAMPVLAAAFEADRFVPLVRGRGRAWLSVASTTVHERGSCPDAALPARVARINADCDEKTARRVMEDIASSRPPAWGMLAVPCAPPKRRLAGLLERLRR